MKMLSPTNKSFSKKVKSKFSEGVSLGTNVVLELSAELVSAESVPEELSVLVKTASSELLVSLEELLVSLEELLVSLEELLVDVEPLGVSISESPLVDEDLFDSSEMFENRTMKTPAQSPRSTIIISM